MDAPPTHLRFTTMNANTGTARTIVKRNPNTNLQQMLVNQYYANSTLSPNSLFYEVLELSLTELETKKVVKLMWLPEGISKEEQLEVLVPKSGQVQDIIPLLQQKLALDEEKVQGIRFYESHLGKFQKELALHFSVAGIQEYMTLFAERIPEEENEMTDDDRFIYAFHFHKEPSKCHNSGIPFKFVIKNVCTRPSQASDSQIIGINRHNRAKFSRRQRSVCKHGQGLRESRLRRLDLQWSRKPSSQSLYSSKMASYIYYGHSIILS